MLNKIIFFAILFIFIIPPNLFGDEWTKKDTALQASYAVLHVIDWSQTIRIQEKKNEGHSEGNYILGKYPSRKKINGYFASTLVGHYLVAKWFDHPHRTIWQSMWIGVEYHIVNRNDKKGIKIGVAF